MLTYILITAIILCFYQFIIQGYKMNKIGKQYKRAKLRQDKENDIFDVNLPCAKQLLKH